MAAFCYYVAIQVYLVGVFNDDYLHTYVTRLPPSEVRRYDGERLQIDAFCRCPVLCVAWENVCSLYAGTEALNHLIVVFCPPSPPRAVACRSLLLTRPPLVAVGGVVESGSLWAAPCCRTS